MKVFSARRLVIARQRRGLTKKALADTIGVSGQSLTFWEVGQRFPSDKAVFALAATLRFPIGFFYAPDIDHIDLNAISFRSRRSMTATTGNRARASGDIAASLITPEFRRLFKFPAIDVPDLSDESPENAAALLRDYWKLGQGPISNMVHLLESKGVQVFWLNESSPCVSAVSFWREQQPFVILNSTNPAGDRARFDCAHELAHLILHRHDSDLDGKEVETQADCFAGAFLLPAEQFHRESPRYPILSEFFPLKERWGVSIQAMVRRYRDIGKMSPWQYHIACKQVSANGWRTKEPVNIKREVSQVHDIVYARLLEKGVNPIEFARQINLTQEELVDLTPVAQKYMRPVRGAKNEESGVGNEETTVVERGGLRLEVYRSA